MWEYEATRVELAVLERLNSARTGTWYCRAFASPACGEWLVRLRREDGLKLAVTVGRATPTQIAHEVSAVTLGLRPAWLSTPSCPA